MTTASTSWPLKMMVFVMMLFMTSMVVAAQPPEAAWDHAGLVNIYNYVGDPIAVHCKDQFTDLKPQRIAHGADYTFKVQPNRKKALCTPALSCGASICPKSFLFGEGAAIKRKCLYKAPRRASSSPLPAFQSVDQRVPLPRRFSRIG